MWMTSSAARGLMIISRGIWGLGFWIWGLGFGTRDLGLGIWDLGFGIRDSGFGIRGLGLGIWDSGLGIWDSGFGMTGKLETVRSAPSRLIDTLVVSGGFCCANEIRAFSIFAALMIFAARMKKFDLRIFDFFDFWCAISATQMELERFLFLSRFWTGQKGVKS